MAVGYIRHWGIGRQMRFITEGGLKFSQKAVKIWLKNGGHLNPRMAERMKVMMHQEVKVSIFRIPYQVRFYLQYHIFN